MRSAMNPQSVQYTLQTSSPQTFSPGNDFLLVVQMPDFSSSGLLNTDDLGL